MIWYVWQKFDDRYGPTWYPRWRWVQQQRWAGEPGRKLTWEETITDMSIAVGEDLFPFFAKTGKALSIERLEKNRQGPEHRTVGKSRVYGQYDQVTCVPNRANRSGRR